MIAFWLNIFALNSQIQSIMLDNVEIRRRHGGRWFECSRDQNQVFFSSYLTYNLHSTSPTFSLILFVIIFKKLLQNFDILLR